MLRRVSLLATLLSAIAFAAMAGCFVRGWFTSDDLRVIWWEPTHRRFVEIYWYGRGGGMLFHAESTTALATDDTSGILAKVGNGNVRLSHDVWPAGGAGYPVLWGDHYRSTPSSGINRNGLSDCWTLEFQEVGALVILGVLPGIWVVRRVRRFWSRRHRRPAGFPVVELP